MPRTARIVVPDVAHHITQRGNNRQDVFFTDDDRLYYLEILSASAQKFALEILGYCLMTNHVHIIAVPKREDSLARSIGRTHLLYCQYINRLHNRSGHLWQNRFYSCPLSDRHLFKALCYIERNPVRARILRFAWHYPWSSAAAHIGSDDPAGIIDTAHWRDLCGNMDWREILSRAEDKNELRQIRTCFSTGRPLADDSFLSKLEHAVGRRLRPLPVGRPKSEKQITRPKKNWLSS
jgi:putative transposase